MNPGSCHPKSLAGLGTTEPINLRWKKLILDKAILKLYIEAYMKQILK